MVGGTAAAQMETETETEAEAGPLALGSVVFVKGMVNKTAASRFNRGRTRLKTLVNDHTKTQREAITFAKKVEVLFSRAAEGPSFELGISTDGAHEQAIGAFSSLKEALSTIESRLRPSLAWEAARVTVVSPPSSFVAHVGSCPVTFNYADEGTLWTCRAAGSSGSAAALCTGASSSAETESAVAASSSTAPCPAPPPRPSDGSHSSRKRKQGEVTLAARVRAALDGDERSSQAARQRFDELWAQRGDSLNVVVDVPRILQQLEEEATASGGLGALRSSLQRSLAASTKAQDEAAAKAQEAVKAQQAAAAAAQAAAEAEAATELALQKLTRAFAKAAKAAKKKSAAR